MSAHTEYKNTLECDALYFLQKKSLVWTRNAGHSETRRSRVALHKGQLVSRTNGAVKENKKKKKNLIRDTHSQETAQMRGRHTQGHALKSRHKADNPDKSGPSWIPMVLSVRGLPRLRRER